MELNLYGSPEDRLGISSILLISQKGDFKIPEENAPKIKYFEPASVENSDFLFDAAIT